jgi:hypothetical protein
MRRLYAQLVDFVLYTPSLMLLRLFMSFSRLCAAALEGRRSTLQVIKPLSSGSRVKKIAQKPPSSFMTFSRVEAYSQTILAGTKDYKSGYYGIEFSQANSGVLHLH